MARLNNIATLFLVTVIAFLFKVAQATSIHFDNLNELQRRDSFDPARIPYVLPPPGESAIADALRKRRPNNTLLALDGVLLNSPVLADVWNDFFTVIRDNNTIPGNMRELILLRTAVLTRTAYIWIQHESVGRSEGLSTDQLRVIRFAPENFLTGTERKVLGNELAAAFELADAIATTIYVPTAVYHNLAKYLSAQQMLEAVAVAGSYALVSRLLIALDVDGKMLMEVPIPK
ncbi:4-carboxymuconolactone decarboxylase [Mycena indigotica]|uniref:4-carboxymuconolactone decarboxylase n=1 Tax=Mycena indigotica TaxID=2126181 RepID=A0A8H6SLW5_9AGAR|nr:4-carboxymuconolactone decarboxylase [Mycena indigotica]KAF7302023.1 4-carboxymuconolactone decarboxylase [Mycena indigotica]